MKAVLLSIKPKYCELIAGREKTIEVRKSKPKLKPPFKCYIYCTKPKYEHEDFIAFNEGTEQAIAFYGGGRIIGEFVCDGIIDLHDNGKEFVIPINRGISELLMPLSCLSYKDLRDYANGKQLYGWHIADLKIYAEPKELSEFISYCSHYEKKKITGRCRKCKHYYVNHTDMLIECDCEGERPITRPPQSFCYVEEDE